jgi:hypothetical protein
MKKDTVEFYLHGNGKPQVQAGLEGETLRDVLARIGALPGDGQFVFVGEPDDALRDPEGEAEEDTDTPADLGATLSVLRVRELRHVHTRAVSRIEVTVNFNGKHRKRKFSPAATVATVLAWAKKRFNIDPTAGADYVLQLLPEKTIPRPEEHLGDLKPGAKSLEFDLVREVTPQGW